MSAADKHLAAAAEFIAIAESGDAKRLAYEKAADEILAAQAADPSLTQIAITRRLGKSRDWISLLLKWRRLDVHEREERMPFYNSAAQSRYRERQEPTRPEDRIEMATKLMGDPEVVKGVLATPARARSEIKMAIHRENAKHREQASKAAQQMREDRAMPLPAYMADMVIKMNEWAMGLQALYDDLDELPEGPGLDSVVRAATFLAEQSQRWVDRLSGKPVVLEVIEGNASRGA
jgi:hypothetical protein